MKNSTKVLIVGLGYVGLPLLNLISKNKKIESFGYDNDKYKISKLKKAESYISDISNNELKKLKKERLFYRKDLYKINQMDYIIICVPTPLKSKNVPDVSSIQSVLTDIYPYLSRGQTIILESTVYPTATESIFLKKLNKRFKVGENFFLCFSPERINPGIRGKFNIRNTTKIISGYSNKCENKIRALYKKVFLKIFLAKSIQTAEFAKLYENTFRSVNIALVNEMKIISKKLNLNIHDIIKACETKEFGFKPFLPGPGVGGHCIPIDPIFLNWAAKKKYVNSKFVELSQSINLNITKWIINNNFVAKKFKNILLIGIGYKANVNDIRHSPALSFVDYFEKKNIKFSYYDQLIPKFTHNKKNYKSLKKLNFNLIKKYDATIILNENDAVDYKSLLKYSNNIYDTRGVYRNILNKKIIYC